MSVTIDAAVGGANANSYLTVAEADAYFKARLEITPSWEAAPDKTAALAMATRVINAVMIPRRRLVDEGGRYSESSRIYITSRGWTGAPATTTQALAWPRTGMFDANGNAILSTVIPQALKDATAELAGQLIASDTTLDNPVSIGGITSVRAGSVAVTFKEMIEQHVLPDGVWLLMPASWFTDEVYESAQRALFDVIS